MKNLRERLIELFVELQYDNPEEFIALALDLRSAIYLNMRMTDKIEHVITSIFPEFELRKLDYGDFAVGLVFKKENRDLVDGVLYQSRYVKDNALLGRLLGYPECCIQNHISADACLLENERPKDPFTVFKIMNNEIPFVINKLLSFSTRVKGNEGYEQYGIYMNDNSFSFEADNKMVYLKNAAFISHIPCSSQCEETIVRANEIANWTKDNIPEMYGLYESLLRHPFLYFGEIINFIGLDGMVKNNEIFYSEIVSIKTLINEDLRRAIGEGNRIKVDDYRIIVAKDNKDIFEYRKKDKDDGIIINFV